jgi:hypothetical protein
MFGLSQSYTIKRECSVCGQYFDQSELKLYLSDNGLKSKEVYNLSDLKSICKCCNRDKSLEGLLNTKIRS